ncbi:MAG: DEAD/DEAH box helicase family protein, partial [Bacilli bacterium]
MNDILAGLKTSLIDKEVESKMYYHHLLIKNDESHTLLSVLKGLILECDEFYFNVAFITSSGVQSLLKVLSEASENGVKGKIVTGNYQYFTNPNAVDRLNQIPNIEVKMNLNDKLHAKGYFFRVKNEWKIIIGSSNMTMSAFSSNTEWNLLVNSTRDGKLVDDVLYSFDELYQSSLLWEVCRGKYIEIFTEKENLKIAFNKNLKDEFHLITPNKMQTEALVSIANLRNRNESRAILISATGSGKTYLSAFDVKEFNPNRCLFIAHRSTILMNALATFETIIDDKTMGIFNGEEKEKDTDYVFANISTLSKDENLTSFEIDEFDYIVVDEVHKSGAKSYQKVLDYFKPKFLLGMSATPERTDGFNIFNMFDNN